MLLLAPAGRLSAETHNAQESPFFMQKMRDMLVQCGTAVRYHSLTVNYEYENDFFPEVNLGNLNVFGASACDPVRGSARERAARRETRRWPASGEHDPRAERERQRG
ncbi:MAG: hypothetical protein ACRYHA_28245 [Janthinobacterium lividum]